MPVRPVEQRVGRVVAENPFLVRVPPEPATQPEGDIPQVRYGDRAVRGFDRGDGGLSGEATVDEVPDVIVAAV